MRYRHGKKLDLDDPFVMEIPQGADVQVNWSDIFGFNGSLYVEVGCGRDEFILRIASENPHVRCVAIDVHSQPLEKLRSKMRESLLTNVRLIRGDAMQILENLFRENEVNKFFVNFPDPWPKNRHLKRRLLSPVFFKLMLSRLSENAKIEIQTDHYEYLKWIIDYVQKVHGLNYVDQDPYYLVKDLPEIEEYETVYEQKFKDIGKQILLLNLVRGNSEK
ncbi:MAG: tRNA (guanosine(46)-N7)-methyltransferase TrmB [Candidatus Theseobacter exili]|nr:tRNA (guanosine(46)-N7)-methyltransferase TrmB [Candidatus Theseobacter exili]